MSKENIWSHGRTELKEYAQNHQELKKLRSSIHNWFLNLGSGDNFF